MHFVECETGRMPLAGRVPSQHPHGNLATKPGTATNVIVLAGRHDPNMA
jgi:hypothetical protein